MRRRRPRFRSQEAVEIRHPIRMPRVAMIIPLLSTRHTMAWRDNTPSALSPVRTVEVVAQPTMRTCAETAGLLRRLLDAVEAGQLDASSARGRGCCGASRARP